MRSPYILGGLAGLLQVEIRNIAPREQKKSTNIEKV